MAVTVTLHLRLIADFAEIMKKVDVWDSFFWGKLFSIKGIGVCVRNSVRGLIKFLS